MFSVHNIYFVYKNKWYMEEFGDLLCGRHALHKESVIFFFCFLWIFKGHKESSLRKFSSFWRQIKTSLVFPQWMIFRLKWSCTRGSDKNGLVILTVVRSLLFTSNDISNNYLSFVVEKNTNLLALHVKSKGKENKIIVH